MPEAHQARQRRKPVRCWFSGKKVPLWMQEGASYGQEATMPEGASYGQEAILPVGAWLGSRSEAEIGGELSPHGTSTMRSFRTKSRSEVRYAEVS